MCCGSRGRKESDMTERLKCTELIHTIGFSASSVGKKSACNARDTIAANSIPELGRSPEEGHGSPLHYSCLENHMDRGASWATDH